MEGLSQHPPPFFAKAALFCVSPPFIITHPQPPFEVRGEKSNAPCEKKSWFPSALPPTLQGILHFSLYSDALPPSPFEEVLTSIRICTPRPKILRRGETSLEFAKELWDPFATSAKTLVKFPFRLGEFLPPPRSFPPFAAAQTIPNYAAITAKSMIDQNFALPPPFLVSTVQFPSLRPFRLSVWN